MRKTGSSRPGRRSMSYDPDHHHRRSTRLRGYDYSQPGAYFVTICTHRRACLLGNVVGTEVRLDAVGQIVQVAWQDLPNRFPGVLLDASVIMPNHIHGIIVITEAAGTPRPQRGRIHRARGREEGGRDESRPYARRDGAHVQGVVCACDQRGQVPSVRVAAQLRRSHHPRTSVARRVPAVHRVEPGSLGR